MAYHRETGGRYLGRWARKSRSQFPECVAAIAGMDQVLIFNHGAGCGATIPMSGALLWAYPWTRRDDATCGAAHSLVRGQGLCVNGIWRWERVDSSCPKQWRGMDRESDMEKPAPLSQSLPMWFTKTDIFTGAGRWRSDLFGSQRWATRMEAGSLWTRATHSRGRSVAHSGRIRRGSRSWMRRRSDTANARAFRL